MLKLKNHDVIKTTFDVAVENLVAACGFDKSESASENFAFVLRDCLEDVIGRIEASHKEGLCWDATHDLADELKTLFNDIEGR